MGIAQLFHKSESWRHKRHAIQPFDSTVAENESTTEQHIADPHDRVGVLQHMGVQPNGRATDFDSVCGGSIPPTPANTPDCYGLRPVWALGVFTVMKKVIYYIKIRLEWQQGVRRYYGVVILLKKRFIRRHAQTDKPLFSFWQDSSKRQKIVKNRAKNLIIISRLLFLWWNYKPQIFDIYLILE